MLVVDLEVAFLHHQRTSSLLDLQCKKHHMLTTLTESYFSPSLLLLSSFFSLLHPVPNHDFACPIGGMQPLVTLKKVAAVEVVHPQMSQLMKPSLALGKLQSLSLKLLMVEHLPKFNYRLLVIMKINKWTKLKSTSK